MSQVKFKSKKGSLNPKVSPPGSSTSSLLTLLILTPLVVIFFCTGVFVGSKLVTPTDEAKPPISIGLPGTNNVFKKWSDTISNNGGKFLRSNPAVSAEIVSKSEGMKPNVMHSDPQQTIATSIHPKLLEPKITVVGASGSLSSRQNSLYAAQGAFMQGPSDLDNSNVLITAWIYLDESSSHDHDMRTVVSNKRPGCESGDGQHGLAMYVNAWQQSDHKLYVEFGGQSSGCHKVDSGAVTLSPMRWYHVGVYAGLDFTALYVDGLEVASQTFDDTHIVQSDNPMLVGQYFDREYPFFGNISQVAVVHDVSVSQRSELAALVSRIKDLSASAELARLPNIKAVFSLSDATTEISNTKAVEAAHGNNGVYTFPAVKVSHNSVQGVSIDLIDGVGKRVVTPEMTADSDRQGRERREEIKKGMLHAWSSYKKYAWGRDELKPISNTAQDNWGGMGVTLVDSLDTLWVMGLKKEFDEAREWVEKSLTFSHAGSVSVFETTIRELGGLLAAFDLSGEKVFLEKAKVLGDLLMPAFNTRSGIPTGMVNFQTHSAGGGWSGNNAILSELGTLQIEFRHLAHHTKTRKYEEKSMKALQLMNKKNPPYGLYPIKINVDDGSFADSQVTFGALGDSFYEYLLKVWLQGGKRETWLREMYDRAIDGVMEKLLLASDPSGMAFLSDWNGRSNQRKMDHLVCFMPGLLVLGAYNDPKGLGSTRAQRDLAVGKALMYTCYQMYERQKTGIAPEYVEFPKGRDMVVGSTAPFYILRPETAESLFILNQLTGEPIYRDWAWNIWTSIEKHCKTKTAYGSLANVNSGNHIDDRMESFFLAETIKYLYLAQDPDKPIDLTEFVFNTEAHPTRILDSSHEDVQA